MSSMIERSKSGGDAPGGLALRSVELLRRDARGRVRTPGPRRAALLAQFDRSGLSAERCGVCEADGDQIPDVRRVAASAAESRTETVGAVAGGGFADGAGFRSGDSPAAGGPAGRSVDGTARRADACGGGTANCVRRRRLQFRSVARLPQNSEPPSL